MSKKREYTECPHCGADVVVGSKVCRECGSDANTGWQSSEEIDYQSIEVPDGYGPEPDTAPRRGWGMRAFAVLLALLVAYLVLNLIWR